MKTISLTNFSLSGEIKDLRNNMMCISTKDVGVLELIDCQKLENYYIRLKYKTNY